MWTPYLSIQEVNNLESDHFIKIFGNVVEHCLAVGIRILKNRPFNDINDIVKAVDSYLESLKPCEKEEILRLYPDSVNQLAGFSNSMLEFSTHQRIVNSSRSLRFEEKKRLKQHSKDYREKFSFPFIICAKEDDVDTICSLMETRLQNSKEVETEIAMKEIKKIAKMRIHEIVQ